MLNKVDMVQLYWSHGEMPSDDDVAELNEWLEKAEESIKVRFEGSPDGMSLYVEKTE